MKNMKPCWKDFNAGIVREIEAVVTLDGEDFAIEEAGDELKPSFGDRLIGDPGFDIEFWIGGSPFMFIAQEFIGAIYFKVE